MNAIYFNIYEFAGLISLGLLTVVLIVLEPQLFKWFLKHDPFRRNKEKKQ